LPNGTGLPTHQIALIIGVNDYFHGIRACCCAKSMLNVI
jgi:hypothetical protein